MNANKLAVAAVVDSLVERDVTARDKKALEAATKKYKAAAEDYFANKVLTLDDPTEFEVALNKAVSELSDKFDLPDNDPCPY